MPTEKTRRLFKCYSSPACILFGILCGIIHAYAAYLGDGTAARLGIAVGFVSAGIMGLSYFERTAMQARTVPYIIELLRMFFFLWLVFGVVYFIRAFGRFPPPDEGVLAVLVYFLVGTIVGTVWMMALLLLVGLRMRVANWTVVRFPVWIGLSITWAWRRIRGSKWKR
jgi:hypothetical protein